MRRGRPTEATCALVSAIPILPRPFRLVPQAGKLGSYQEWRSRRKHVPPVSAAMGKPSGRPFR